MPCEEKVNVDEEVGHLPSCAWASMGYLRCLLWLMLNKFEALNLQTQPSPPPSPTFTTPTLPDLLRQELSMESDQKPSISSLSTTRGESGGSGEKLSYAESWMPGLPEKWTYATPDVCVSHSLC